MTRDDAGSSRHPSLLGEAPALGAVLAFLRGVRVAVSAAMRHWLRPARSA